jgi:hypothetical protein
MEKNEEKIITTLPDLMEYYKEVAEKTGIFVLIGIPIPTGRNINFNTAIWLNKIISEPNVIGDYRVSRFASQGWNETVEMVLNKWPFVTHVLLMAADEYPIDEKAVQYMVALDKDVVAAPCPLLQRHKGVCWNVTADPCAEPINFIGWDELPVEPFEIKWAGNPWLIKRKVLEEMEWPYFKDVFRQERGRKIGNDMFFCKKVVDAGYEFWCEPRAKFEHHSHADLNFIMQEYADSKKEIYGLSWGDFSIQQEDWDFIKGIIEEEEIKNVLEFGSGLSSLLISELVKVDSYETDLKYANTIRKKTSSQNLNIKMWDGKHFDSDKQYDLVFVDGPVLSEDSNREHSIKAASKSSDRIIIHDGLREDERKWQEKYIEPDFDFVKTNNMCNYWIRKINLSEQEI